MLCFCHDTTWLQSELARRHIMIVSTVVTLSVLMCVPKSSYTIITVQYSMRHAG